MSELSLTDIANAYETDKGDADKYSLSWGSKYPLHNTWGYTKIYERYMERYRYKDIKLFEIGICDPRFPFASPQMWREYFSRGKIYCMDNFWGKSSEEQKEGIKLLEKARVNFFYGDQSSKYSFDAFFSIYGDDFRFVIEDGSHQPFHMMFSLARILPHMKSEGVYFMEDIQHPKLTKGMYGYDNTQVLFDLMKFSRTHQLQSNLISKEDCDCINDNVTSVEIFESINPGNFLAVIIKR